MCARGDGKFKLGNGMFAREDGKLRQVVESLRVMVVKSNWGVECLQGVMVNSDWVVECLQGVVVNSYWGGGWVSSSSDWKMECLHTSTKLPTCRTGKCPFIPKVAVATFLSLIGIGPREVMRSVTACIGA